MNLSPDLHRAIKIRSAETGILMQDLIAESWKAYTSTSQSPQKGESGISTVPNSKTKADVVPSQYAGLSKEQVEIVQLVMEILRMPEDQRSEMHRLLVYTLERTRQLERHRRGSKQKFGTSS